MSDQARIGVLGGTFDPIHRGHIEPVREIADRFGWERILIIPGNRQPFKQGGEATSAYHRFAMAVLACGDDGRFRVSPVELERGGVSYTVDTLAELEPAGGAIDWIIGDDQLPSLDRWRSVGRILEMANFVILRRGGSEQDLPRVFHERVSTPEGRGPCGSIVFAGNHVVRIAATEIRQRLLDGGDIEEFVHPRVAEYIRRSGLYRGSAVRSNGGYA